jgi:peptide-methionine (S)-S-oxide reductase
MIFRQSQSRRLNTATRLAVPILCLAVAATASILTMIGQSSAETAVALPPPVVSDADTKSTTQKVVLAGGCFWGVQAVFQHVKGVKDAVSGYAGGKKETASYEQVSSGRTGHAESVEVTFDPDIVSYGTILQIYFSVAHNPTELNRQGPDEGTQYRSEIFYESQDQKRVAQSYVAQLEAAKIFPSPIVTQIAPLDGFYPAEGYHQDYATRNPDSPYIAYNDLPKVDNLGRLFPGLFRSKPKLVAEAEGVN